MENNIDNFFKDVSYIFDLPSSKNEPVQASKPVQVSNPQESMMPETKEIPQDQKVGQRTNVIYLNTDCNLRCEYCYEGDSREGMPDKAHLTPDKIDAFLQEIVDREKQFHNSTVVVMGGEPFLRFDLIKYTLLKAMTLDHSFGISLITNATLLTDKRIQELKHLLNLSQNKGVSLSLEVSYDGTGHFRRPFAGGVDSKQIVEEKIQKLLDAEIKIKISYTTHMGNYKHLLEDTIYIFEKFNSPYLDRITIGYAYSDLDNTGLATDKSNAGEIIRKSVIPGMIKIYEKYGKPICGHTCGPCQLCDKGNFVGNSYLSPTTGVTYAEKKTGHEFKQF